VSCFSTLVTRERKRLCIPTSINIHRNRVSMGWSMLVIHTPLQSLKLNSVEGGWTGRSRSNTQSSVGRSEGFIGGSVLVNGPGCSVPVCWNHVRRMSRRHGCYSILNLSVKSSTEFQRSLSSPTDSGGTPPDCIWQGAQPKWPFFSPRNPPD